MTPIPGHLSRGALEACTREVRTPRLGELSRWLNAELASCGERDAFWRQVDELIEALRALGHDLWSHDYDGEATHLWGGDYMRPETMGHLVLEFTFPDGVRVEWRRWTAVVD